MKEGSHLVISREPGWIIIHATQIDADDLVNVCRVLGVLKE
jgi:hypothetical protein